MPDDRKLVDKSLIDARARRLAVTSERRDCRLLLRRLRVLRAHCELALRRRLPWAVILHGDRHLAARTRRGDFLVALYERDAEQRSGHEDS